MIKQDIGGYKFGRGQLTGTYLSGPLAGVTLYFGDVEVTRSFTAGDEFKRYTPETANKTLAFQDYDGGEIGGTIQFFQWNEVAKDVEAMGQKMAGKDQAAAVGITVTGVAGKNNRLILGKFDVKNVVVQDGKGANPVVYVEGVDYTLHNDGDSIAVVTLLTKPATSDAVVKATFDTNAKKLDVRGLLQNSKFEMALLFEERVKSDNPTKPGTTFLEKCSIVLDQDISVFNTGADLKTVSAKFTALANPDRPDGLQYGYTVYPNPVQA